MQTSSCTYQELRRVRGRPGWGCVGCGADRAGGVGGVGGVEVELLGAVGGVAVRDAHLPAPLETHTPQLVKRRQTPQLVKRRRAKSSRRTTDIPIEVCEYHDTCKKHCFKTLKSKGSEGQGERRQRLMALRVPPRRLRNQRLARLGLSGQAADRRRTGGGPAASEYSVYQDTAA